MGANRVLAIISIVLGIVVGIWVVLLSSATVADVAKTSSQASAQIGAQTPGIRMIGNPDAKVKLVLYSDFQCSHCAELHKTVEPELIKRYVATGKVSLAVRMIRIVGAESELSAVAALCADDQGKFWQYRDALYPAYEIGGKPAFSADSLKRLAQKLGLESATFDLALDGGKHKEDVINDTAKAKSDVALAKVDGPFYVPTMFINGRMIEGTRPLEEYTTIIEEELAK